MIRLNDVQADKDGRPLNLAPKILKTKVLLNPFDDIVPRIDSRKLDKNVEKPKSQSRATKWVCNIEDPLPHSTPPHPLPFKGTLTSCLLGKRLKMMKNRLLRLARSVMLTTACCSLKHFFLSQDIKIKSSHDVLTDDPKLSSEPAVEPPPQPKKDREKYARVLNRTP